MSQKYSSMHYNDYLELKNILNSQNLRSVEVGHPAHDEMLFIIIHQVYELWFKQIIHELGSIADMMKDGKFDETNMGTATARLYRVCEIQKVMIEQIRILETMTPLDFLDFRNYIIPASGFQSFQFRIAEIMLGLRRDERLQYNQSVYASVFDDEKRAILEKLESQNSLFDLVEQWLERTPFLKTDRFNFKESYISAVKNMTQKERDSINETDYIAQQDKDIRLNMLQQTENYILSALDESKHKTMQENAEIRLSHKAVMGALLINLYRDMPILRQAFAFLTALVEIDEQFTHFRFRHSQMVLRMLGKKMGTGGSSGYEYLRSTVEKHKIFADLHNISTLLIPRSDLPELPEETLKQLGYYFNAQ